MRPLVSAVTLALVSGCTSVAPSGATSVSGSDSLARGSELYATHCVSCHGPDRLGLTAPALLPESLERVKKKEAAQVILEGRPSTQMPGFSDRLSEADALALADFLYSPPARQPLWTIEQIRASRTQDADMAGREVFNRPVFKVDPLNLFFVVELGDHAVTVLDGDRFEPIHRFKSRFGLHGGIKFSTDGRFAYLGSRDGWVSRFDVYGMRMAGEVRVGLNTRNIAVSSDGKWIIAGNYVPRNVVILDSQTMQPVQVIDATNRDGKPSRVSAVYVAPPRESFLVALKDVPELWEISFKPGTKAPYEGLVHDYRPESGEILTGDSEKQTFPLRRIPLEKGILDDFFFDHRYVNVLGASRESATAQVVNLWVGRSIVDVPVRGMPHLGSGIGFTREGRRLMATPNLKDGLISFVDTETWKVIKELKTPGPGFFLRSHENSPYAFADVFFGKEKDSILVIDKKTLEIVRVLKPAPGKTAAHTEFTRDGKYALVSIWENDGAIVVYDAKTLREVKRIPMKKPSGKYNVYNKIHFSEGTSH